MLLTPASRLSCLAFFKCNFLGRGTYSSKINKRFNSTNEELNKLKEIFEGCSASIVAFENCNLGDDYSCSPIIDAIIDSGFINKLEAFWIVKYEYGWEPENLKDYLEAKGFGSIKVIEKSSMEME